MPFLGLGVDDAFVLAGEMARHGITDPSAMAPELLALTAKTGGISVLVMTSFTQERSLCCITRSGSQSY
eukprot:4713491-Amphidinium_carterae.1